MSNLKKAHELIRQNEQIVKKSQKHDANLQKNSTLYFQIGLIVCLMTVYGLFEMKFETAITQKLAYVNPVEDPTEVIISNIKVYVEPVKEVKPKPKKTVTITEDPVIVENEDPEKEDVLDTPDTEVPQEKPIAISDVKLVDKPEEGGNVSFIAIQDAPIYPGCEKAKNNKERKKCMSKKIAKLIQRRFDGSVASDYGLSGRQKIDVQFTIDKTGHVTAIKTRAPHPKLEEEAVKVINVIPEMKPGRQHNKNVGVIYTLPIVFDVL
ncbi:hypothetical protein A8C32_10730 [Flavivirga aquatica]|uniref:TonB C-terminal domain-containing protein n=1 Tax=Flavivirga aquatica TaxID=1849968 RepID=A0A1E5TCX4_9FLAO|nr:energy transducer TonB [Flavivirga aquatica]OEK09197.1 hypothetical protein A8C32_10730 [Flavivirga aquatica]